LAIGEGSFGPWFDTDSILLRRWNIIGKIWGEKIEGPGTGIRKEAVWVMWIPILESKSDSRMGHPL
jgi:hypothetical protein